MRTLNAQPRQPTKAKTPSEIPSLWSWTAKAKRLLQGAAISWSLPWGAEAPACASPCLRAVLWSSVWPPHACAAHAHGRSPWSAPSAPSAPRARAPAGSPRCAPAAPAPSPSRNLNSGIQQQTPLSKNNSPLGSELKGYQTKGSSEQNTLKGFGIHGLRNFASRAMLKYYRFLHGGETSLVT